MQRPEEGFRFVTYGITGLFLWLNGHMGAEIEKQVL